MSIVCNIWIIFFLELNWLFYELNVATSQICMDPRFFGMSCFKQIFLIDSSVDFKSEYNKTKISEMDISNIYLKKTKVLKTE